MDETNEIEALAKAYEKARAAKWNDGSFTQRDVHAYALLAVRDAVLASLAERGGIMSAETVAKDIATLRRVLDNPKFEPELERLAAQGATIAALQQAEEKSKAHARRLEVMCQSETERADAAEARAEQAEREASGQKKINDRLSEECTRLESEHEAMTTRLITSENARTLAERERDEWKAAEALSSHRWQRAESALATVREAAVKASTELRHTFRPETRDWNLVARAIRILEEATTPGATPAPEHPDTATLRSIRERADDSPWLQAIALRLGMGKVSFEQIQALIRAVLGDSGPSGGGEKCAVCSAPAVCMGTETGHTNEGACSECCDHGRGECQPVNPATPGLAACVPVSATPAAHLDTMLAEYHGEPTE